MKKLGLLSMLVAVLFTGAAEAGHGKRKSSQAVFSANRGQMIKVFVDGKLVNQYPQEKVKVMLIPGKNQVKVKIFNRRGRNNGVLHGQLHVARGFTNYYTIGLNRYGELNMRNTAKVQRTSYQYGKKKSHKWKLELRSYDRRATRNGRFY